MIGLQQQRIHSLQAFHCIVIIHPQIGADCHSFAAISNSVGNGLCRIMGYAHGIYGQILYDEFLILFHLMEQSMIHIPQSCTVLHSFDSAGCGIDGDFVFPGNDPQPLNMIGMFVRNQYSVYIPPCQIQFL